MSKSVEEFIKENDALDSLLNKKEIKLLNNFANGGIYTDERKAQISDAYHESFMEIFENSIHDPKKKGTIASLLRTVGYLATPEVKAKIASLEGIRGLLVGASERLEKVKRDVFENNDEQILVYALTEYKMLESNTILILNDLALNDENKQLKNQIVTTCLDICDKLAKTNSSRKNEKFQLYNLVVGSLSKVKSVEPSLRERYKSHMVKAVSKNQTANTKYWIGFVFVLILLLLRLLSRLG